MRLRHDTDPTLVIDRAKLPPISETLVASLDLDPDHPETRALGRAYAELEQDLRDTMVPCPPCGGCVGEDCVYCDGRGLVDPATAAALRPSPIPHEVA